MSEQTLDEIAAKVWRLAMTADLPDEARVAAIMHAAGMVLRRKRETHPETTEEDVMRAFARTIPPGLRERMS